MKPSLMALGCAVLVAGCSPGSATAPENLAASTIAGPDDPFWKGAFAPVSDTAESGPGDLTFAFAGFGRPGALQFSRGLVLQTRPLSQPGIAQAYGRDGPETWGDLLGLPETAQIEVRQVTASAAPSGAAPLCPGGAPTHVVIGVRPGLDHPGSIALALFAGEEPPGPKARASTACGVFDYAIPG